MRTTIDEAGRVVIPRSLRNRIGLAGGGEVEIELEGAAIRIEPVAHTKLREDGGLLFIPTTGTPIDDSLVRELIDGEAEAADLGGDLARLGISGGAVYDALVGAAARQHRLPLVSADTRARPVYEALGVEIELIP